ncbi:Fimbrial protein precursor [compost metagenome]
MVGKFDGFTLIELVIVVAVLGALAAITIPQFGEYRARVGDSSAQADVRNMIQVVKSSMR